MFKKVCIASAAILTLIAMATSYVATTSFSARRDELHKKASAITEVCSALRDESFRYEEAKRNALAAYDVELAHLRSSGEKKNLNFRRLLAGTSTESFTRAAGEFARALEECEEVLENESIDLPVQRTSPSQVREAARSLAEMLLEPGAAQQPSAGEMKTLEQLEAIDQELVGRSGKALPAAAAARDKALHDALSLTAQADRLGNLALLLQLLATGFVMSKDLGD